MKRTILITFLLCILFLLVSCTKELPQTGTQVRFYYIKNDLEFGTDAPLLTSALRTVPTEDNTPEALIRLYLNGPTSYDCVSPFPGGTELVEMYVDGTRASLLLSPHIGTLSPSQQTIAYACLTRTVIELTGVTTVQVRLQNYLINGEETAVFSEDSFAFFDSMSMENQSK